MHHSPETRTAIRTLEDELLEVRQEGRDRIKTAIFDVYTARSAAPGALLDPVRKAAEAHLVEIRHEARRAIAEAKQRTTRAIEDLRQESQTAHDAEKAEDKESKPSFTSEICQELAERLRDRFYSHTDGEPTLRFWSDGWWRWQEGAWSLQTERDVEDRVVGHLVHPEPAGLAIQKLTSAARDRILLELRLFLALPKSQEFETWLPAMDETNRTIEVTGTTTEDGLGEPTWLSTAEHVVRVDTKEVIKLSSTPRYWTSCAIPHKIEAGLKAPRWEEFLLEVLEQDGERFLLLQEWFGYCCIPSTRFQKLLMLVGEGGNGKSTVLNVLTAMLHSRNVSNCSLANIAEKHGTFVTFGKLLNAYDDIATRYMRDTGQLKAYTGSGNVIFEKKYCDPFSAKPTARLCFSMNAIPRTEDDSKGFWRRLIIFPFRWAPETENPAYADLRHPECPFPKELGGILAWSLQGLRRLIRQQGFTDSTVCNNELEFWRSNNENVRRYANERLVFNPTATGRQGSTAVSSISADYRTWNKINREKPFSTQGMAQRLKRVYSKQGVLNQKNFQFGVKEMPYFVGLTFNPKAPSMGTATEDLQLTFNS